MSAKATFLKALLNIGGGTVFVAISRFISVFIAVRYLTIDEMGVYFLVMIAISILSTVASFGTNTSLVKFITEKTDDRQKMHIILTSLNAYLLSLIFFLIIALFINLYWSLLKINIWYIFLFLSLSIFTQLNIAFQGLKQFKLIAVSNGVNGFTKIIFVFLMLVVFEKGFTGLIVALSLSNLSALMFQLHLLYRKTRLADVLNFDGRFLKEMLIFSFPIYLNQLYSILYTKGYSILLAAMLNPAAVAYFNIATRIPNMVEQVRQVYITVFFPTILDLVKGRFEKAKDLLHVSVVFGFIVVIIGAGVFFPFQKEIMVLIFSVKYEVCSLAAFIMLVRCVFTFSNPIMGYTLIALGQTKAPLYINVTITTIAFGTTYFLISSFGYMAAVYVSFAASSLSFFLNWLYLKFSGMHIKWWSHISAIFISFSVFLFSMVYGHNLYILLAGIAFTAIILIVLKTLFKICNWDLKKYLHWPNLKF